MTFDWGIAIALATGISSWVGVVYLGVFRYAQLSLKVDVLWDFQLRRGLVELTNRGMGHMNSPILITEAAKRLMASLAPDLHRFYMRFTRPPSDSELAEEIERQFGDRLVQEFCIPNGIYEGACLLIAMAIAREGAAQSAAAAAAAA